MKKFSLFLIVALILVNGFGGYQIVQAVGGQGTATIDGAANVTVTQATSHKFTVVLTIGVDGITANAQNPTFTIPAGFTAPNATPVANESLVNADGKWSVTAAGGTCTVETPTAGLTVASGQVITVDVTTTCATGHTPPDTITLTYQGQSAIAMAATPLNIGTAVDIGAGAVTYISAPPTITVTGALPTLTVTTTVINDNAGTKAISDFPLFIDSISVTSGVASTTSAGLHTISQTSVSGYTTTIGGNCAADGTITLELGDVKTCTITNDDIASAVAASPSVGGSYYSLEPPLIDVVKVPSPLALLAPGPVTYTYTLRNIGTVPVNDITMVGDTCSPINLVSGDINGDARLDGDETWTYNCSTTLSKTHTNIVTATGWANNISATDIANATVVVGVPLVPPLIHVTKVPSPLALLAGGGMITYTNKVTNPGTAPLSNIYLTDDKCSSVEYISGDINGDSKLDTTETWTYACQTKLAKTTVNTVTASGEANGLTTRDFAIATVVVAAATPSQAPGTSIPSLPNTGFPPKEKSIPWNIIIPAGIFAVLIFFYFARRKQTA